MEYSIEINTTQEFLDSLELSLEEVQNEVNSFIQLLGKKYFEIFSTKLGSNEISDILYYKSVLEPISKCEGFRRHIKAYNTAEFGNHLFTAKVANFLIKKGFTIELEPKMKSKDGPHPDLKFQIGELIGYAECKTSDISRFYDIKTKEHIADIVYEAIPTCDQLDLYFQDKIEIDEIRSILTDKDVIKQIHMIPLSGKVGQEYRLQITEDFSIGIIKNLAIIGAPEDFPNITMTGFLEDIHTGLRMIMTRFNKGGQSVGVSNVIDYTNKLKAKKEQSSGQVIDNYPNIVFLRDSDVFGDPENHLEYINSEWFNDRHEFLSGVAFYATYNHPSSGIVDNLTYYENPNAKIKIDLRNYPL